MSAESTISPDTYRQLKQRGWIITIAIAAALAFALISVKFDGPLEASSKPSISLEQCANLGTTCDAAHSAQWQTGNLGSSNSAYPEGSSVPFRSVMTGLTSGQTYLVSLEWDSTEMGGHHAYDYITSYGRTEVNALPCSGITCNATTNTLSIPNDSHVTGAGVTPVVGQSFSVFGGSFPASGASVSNTGDLCGSATCVISSNPSSYSFSGSFAVASQTGIKLYVTAASSTVLLAWGGHVSRAADWGAGNSASALSGSPYHMRVVDLGCSNYDHCSAGNMDRSMSANAVVATTTTTLAPTTTTVAPTTTTLAPTTTTTLAPTTTTVSPTSTVVIAAVTTTTVPSELQVVVPNGTEGVDGTADVVFPDELPVTGWRFGYNGLLAILIIIVGASLYALSGPRRGRKSGGK
jgi:hypothetical protein